jgi:hypothetical protein
MWYFGTESSYFDIDVFETESSSFCISELSLVPSISKELDSVPKYRKN